MRRLMPVVSRAAQQILGSSYSFIAVQMKDYKQLTLNPRARLPFFPQSPQGLQRNTGRVRVEGFAWS